LAHRGQEELLAALSHVSDLNIHLLYVGRGEAEIELKQRAVAAGLATRVHFVGYIPAAELQRVYAAMDVAFVAQAGNDASARAALEAMACQLPVIAVQNDELRDTVTAERGYPIAACAPELIAQAIQELISDPKKMACLSKTGREYVTSNRGFDREAAETIAFYRALKR
jgi:glycosyltransferase involved in cell wall biosynthesis